MFDIGRTFAVPVGLSAQRATCEEWLAARGEMISDRDPQLGPCGGFRVASTILHTPQRQAWISTMLLDVINFVVGAPVWETMIFCDDSRLDKERWQWGDRELAARQHQLIACQMALVLAMEFGETVTSVDSWPKEIGQ